MEKLQYQEIIADCIILFLGVEMLRRKIDQKMCPNLMTSLGGRIRTIGALMRNMTVKLIWKAVIRNICSDMLTSKYFDIFYVINILRVYSLNQVILVKNVQDSVENTSYECTIYTTNHVLLIFRVLLRVRMMYYIKHEVIGDYAAQIENGVHARYSSLENLLNIEHQFRSDQIYS